MEEKVKYYDLSFAQDIMFYTLRVVPKKSVVNIGSAFWFNVEIDEDLLEKAIYKTIERIDALRIRFVKVNGKYKQYVYEGEPKKVVREDLSNLTVEEIDNTFTKWTCKAIKYKDCESYEFKIVKGPNGMTIMYLKVNHVALDAWGLTVFGKDLIDVYAAMKAGRELPPPPEQFMPLVEKDLAYATSEKYKKDFGFWKEQFNEKPVYSAVVPKYVGKPYRKTSLLKFASQSKIYHLQKEKVDIIKKFCAENRLSPQIIFLLGAACYFFILNNNNEVIIGDVAGRRTNIKCKRASGMMLNPVPFKVQCDSGLTFLEACNKLTVEQFGIFRHADFPYEQITKYIQETYYNGKATSAIMDMSYTYQLGKIVADESVPFNIKTYSNGMSGVPAYITIMDLEDSGTLEFLIEYNRTCTKEDISKIYYQMLKAIELGIGNPCITIGEILKKVSGMSEPSGITNSSGKGEKVYAQ